MLANDAACGTAAGIDLLAPGGRPSRDCLVNDKDYLDRHDLNPLSSSSDHNERSSTMAEIFPEAKEPEFPSASLPSIFADAVSKVAANGEVAKVYLIRFDPAFQDDHDLVRALPIAQLTMPRSSFVYMVAQLADTVRGWIEGGYRPTDLDEEDIVAARNHLRLDWTPPKRSGDKA